MVDLKNLSFYDSANSQYFFSNMVVMLSNVRSETGKKCIFLFFAYFRPYVGQPDSHIGSAISIPFASIYSTDPRTNLWNFREKILRIGGFEKLSFLSRPFWIFFPKKNVLSHENQSQIMW